MAAGLRKVLSRYGHANTWMQYAMPRMGMFAAEPGTKNPARWSSAVNEQAMATKRQTKEFVETSVERVRARNSRSKDLDTTMNDPALSAEHKEREASALRKSERDFLRCLRKTA